MGGASARHGLVVTGLGLALGPHARRKRCQLFMADMKLRVEHSDQTYFYYPDLLLACDPQDREPYYRRRPCLIVEVLSPSTEKHDRGVKLEDYAAHGVGEYWVMDAERRVVEQYVLRGSSYDLTLKSSTGELRSEVIPGLIVPVRAFFYAEDNMRALRELMGK